MNLFTELSQEQIDDLLQTPEATFALLHMSIQEFLIEKEYEMHNKKQMWELLQK